MESEPPCERVDHCPRPAPKTCEVIPLPITENEPTNLTKSEGEPVDTASCSSTAAKHDASATSVASDQNEKNEKVSEFRHKIAAAALGFDTEPKQTPSTHTVASKKPSSSIYPNMPWSEADDAANCSTVQDLPERPTVVLNTTKEAVNVAEAAPLNDVDVVTPKSSAAIMNVSGNEAVVSSPEDCFVDCETNCGETNETTTAGNSLNSSQEIDGIIDTTTMAASATTSTVDYQISAVNRSSSMARVVAEVSPIVTQLIRPQSSNQVDALQSSSRHSTTSGNNNNSVVTAMVQGSSQYPHETSLVPVVPPGALSVMRGNIDPAGLIRQGTFPVTMPPPVPHPVSGTTVVYHTTYVVQPVYVPVYVGPDGSTSAGLPGGAGRFMPGQVPGQMIPPNMPTNVNNQMGSTSGSTSSPTDPYNVCRSPPYL